MDFEERDLIEYSQYIGDVMKRIQFLNSLSDNKIRIEDIKLGHISKSSEGKWSFDYTIKGRSDWSSDKIFGHILYDNYNDWKLQKIVDERERKLNILGI